MEYGKRLLTDIILYADSKGLDLTEVQKEHNRLKEEHRTIYGSLKPVMLQDFEKYKSMIKGRQLYCYHRTRHYIDEKSKK